MAITDNMVFRILALAGQSTVTDTVAAQTLTHSGGTLTLVNDGTYGYLWRLVGGSLSNSSLTGQGTYGEGVTKTVALRFRITSRQAAFTRWMVFGRDGDNGFFIGNNADTGSTPIRTGQLYGGSPLMNAAPTLPSNTVYTIVIKLTGSATDSQDCWFQTVGRVGTSPDSALTSSQNLFTIGMSYLALIAAASETMDILDLVHWDRGLTNAEAAAIADDLRATLDGGSPTLSSVPRRGGVRLSNLMNF